VGQQYAKNAGAVFRLKYRMVWCPKYRRPVLVKPVDARLKELFAAEGRTLGIDDSPNAGRPGHVPLLVEGIATICIAEIVNGLKGFTSRIARAVSVSQVAIAYALEPKLLCRIGRYGE
jgi:putative transposase